MKKPELLAPAGNMECLKAAILAGCDAVYLGGNMFGARSFANNFDYDELKEAGKWEKECKEIAKRVLNKQKESDKNE